MVYMKGYRNLKNIARRKYLSMGLDPSREGEENRRPRLGTTRVEIALARLRPEAP